MSYKIILLLLLVFLTAKMTIAQNQTCDSIEDYPDTPASFKDNSREVLQFFNENMLDIIYDVDSGEMPPTSFKMILIVNDQGEVKSISKIRGDYSEEIQAKILEVLRKEEGWKSAEVNGEKVCSKYYFTIGCILLH